jgi:hypothetical protein
MKKSQPLTTRPELPNLEDLILMNKPKKRLTSRPGLTNRLMALPRPALRVKNSRKKSPRPKKQMPKLRKRSK